MKRGISAWLIVGIGLLPTQGGAYELATHALLTENAYQRSVLELEPWFLESLDIDATDLKVFGEVYYDISGTEVRTRTQRDFEKTKMPRSGEDFLTVKGWLMRGAIREDDVVALDDPVNAIRVLNHFYDPVNKRPLTVLVGLGKTAPNWARGSADAFAQPDTPDPNRNNHYAWFDAREAFYRALSGRSGANSTAIYPDGTGGTRALGDVLHLVEDMAQPQHTRNDAHFVRKDRFDKTVDNTSFTREATT